ncbi:MAG: hypothetical protein Q8R57_06360 [Bacteroidota bacterium]|nr:hypothetical protein [Bacteroidota bacterium]
MKKTIQLILLALCFGIAPLNQLLAHTNAPLPKTTLTEKNNPIALINRLEQIEQLDKSKLSKGEKKILIKEVKAIEKQLKTMDGGVYLSVGAIIIILLLLVLIL